jgi:hypothetical protein
MTSIRSHDLRSWVDHNYTPPEIIFQDLSQIAILFEPGNLCSFPDESHIANYYNSAEIAVKRYRDMRPPIKDTVKKIEQLLKLEPEGCVSIKKSFFDKLSQLFTELPARESEESVSLPIIVQNTKEKEQQKADEELRTWTLWNTKGKRTIEEAIVILDDPNDLDVPYNPPHSLPIDIPNHRKLSENAACNLRTSGKITSEKNGSGAPSSVSSSTGTVQSVTGSVYEESSSLSKLQDSFIESSPEPAFLSQYEEEILKRQKQESAIKDMGEAWIKDYATELFEWILTRFPEILKDEEVALYIKGLFFKNVCKTSSDDEMINKFITMFEKPFLEHGLDKLIESIQNTLKELLKDPVLSKEFTSLVLELVTPCCFQEPKTFDSFKKRLILHILKGIKEFIGDYNDAREEIAKLPESIRNKKRTPEEKENFLLDHFISVGQSKERPIFMKSGDTPMNIQKNIIEAIKETLDCFLKTQNLAILENNPPLCTLAVPFLSVYLSDVIQNLFSSYTVAIVIQKIYNDGIVFVNPYDNKSTPPKQEAIDKQFNHDLASFFYEIAKEILRLGLASKLIQGVIHILKPAIKSKMKTQADKVQKELIEVMSSPCTIRPLLVLHQILYQNTENKNIPVLQNCFGKSIEEKKQFQEQVKTLLPENPYQKFRRLIDKELSDLQIIIIEKFASLKDVFNHLAENSFELLMQDKFLKLLFFYLNDAIQKFLEEPAQQSTQVVP